MRTSLGQKMHLPGQGNGLVKTVIGATPDSVLVGFFSNSESKSWEAVNFESSDKRFLYPAKISDCENTLPFSLANFFLYFSICNRLSPSAASKTASNCESCSASLLYCVCDMQAIISLVRPYPYGRQNNQTISKHHHQFL